MSITEVTGRAARVIAAYDQQGWHRTGTEVDARSAEWLAGELRALGLGAGLEPFALDRVDPVECWVEARGERIEAVPVFDGGSADGIIEGTLGPLGSAAAIGLVDAGPGAGRTAGLDGSRREDAHRAIIVVTRGGWPGLALRNAPAFLDPFGPPVLQVSSESASALEGAHTVRVMARVERTPARAFNVVARAPGRDPEAAPVAVITPRSGWWQCAGERGGGIACFIEIARKMAQDPPARDVLLVASSGHELGHLGLDAYLDDHAAEAASVSSWLHLGASIGARDAHLRLMCSDDESEALVTPLLRDAGCPMPEPVARGVVPAGESRNLHERGWRYISLLGGSPWFHLEADRWPGSVDIDAVAAFADATARLVQRLAGPELVSDGP